MKNFRISSSNTKALIMKSSCSSVIIYSFDENQVDDFYGLLFNEIDIVKEGI